MWSCRGMERKSSWSRRHCSLLTRCTSHGEGRRTEQLRVRALSALRVLRKGDFLVGLPLEDVLEVDQELQVADVIQHNAVMVSAVVLAHLRGEDTEQVTDGHGAWIPEP